MTIALTEAVARQTPEYRDDEAHLVCPDCFPDPQFGQLVTGLCGAQELFEGFVECGSVPDCVACHTLQWCKTCKEPVLPWQ